jgi:hypothetical protein
MLEACGQVSDTPTGVGGLIGVDETGGAGPEGGADSMGVGWCTEIDGCTELEECSDEGLNCERYFPEREECTCLEDPPLWHGDDGACSIDSFSTCDVVQPNLGCHCQSEPPTANSFEKAGCLGAVMGDEGTPIYGLCAYDLMGEENGAFLPSWVDGEVPVLDFEACLAPHTGGDINRGGALADLDSCACLSAGGTPVVGNFPEEGFHYAGCGNTELLLSARFQPEGFCAYALVSQPDRWQVCAWFPTAFAPMGWQLTTCSHCAPE